MTLLFGVPLLVILAGSFVYCILSAVAAKRYCRVQPPRLEKIQPISVLKPLAGADEGVEDNIRSFFEQDYPAFEILFAVREPGDPAVPIVQALREEYPNVPSRLIFTGEPPWPNAKVYSLDCMMRAARHDLLVMSDSDVRAGNNLLATLAAEFQNPRLGVATCPYRAIPGRSFWSRLEALGMNTEFWAGVVVARMIEGMKFAVGPTAAARREAIERIGGFERLKDYIASEDFMMGRLIAGAGYESILSSFIVDHHIGSEDLRRNAAHRLRWCRTTRRSRPWGYVGQVFTNPLPVAALLMLVWPLWPLLIAAMALRAAAAWAIAECMLDDPISLRNWWMGPIENFLSFGFWIAGFFGNTIEWRGRTYRLLPDGRAESK